MLNQSLIYYMYNLVFFCISYIPDCCHLWSRNCSIFSFLCSVLLTTVWFYRGGGFGVLFLFGHYIVCSSSSYSFWLLCPWQIIRYLQIWPKQVFFCIIYICWNVALHLLEKRMYIRWSMEFWDICSMFLHLLV